MNWYEITDEYNKRTSQHEYRLSSLPTDWQRELAALSRLEMDVNNGGYLQFLSNWGRESYVYASQGLKRTGALKMAELVDRCQALVDEHFIAEGKSTGELRQLSPNQIVDLNKGEVIKEAGSVLPESIVERVYQLSYEFMDYPEDLAALGVKHYRSLVEGESQSQQP